MLRFSLDYYYWQTFTRSEGSFGVGAKRTLHEVQGGAWNNQANGGFRRSGGLSNGDFGPGGNRFGKGRR
jgi:hypothetical protein